MNVARSDVESEHENGHRQDDIDGTPLNSLSDIKLAARIRVYLVTARTTSAILNHSFPV
jgi:hypothetical protein